MAAALGSLSPLIFASVAGGSVTSHGIYLLASVPSTNAATLKGGFGFTSGIRSQITSRGLSIAASASPLGATQTLNNAATVNAALQPGGFDFTSIWPQSLLGATGLKNPGTASAVSPLGIFANTATLNNAKLPDGFWAQPNWPNAFISSGGLKIAGTVSAVSPLGMLFDGDMLNQSVLPGADPGLEPLYGTLSLAPYGVHISGVSTAFGNLGYLLNSATLNQSKLAGADPGLMPLIGAWFAGTHGVASPPTLANIANAGLSYLYGYTIFGTLPTYYSANSGAAALYKTFVNADKGRALLKTTFASTDAGAASRCLTVKSADAGTAKLAKTFTGIDRGAVSKYATFGVQDSGGCFLGQNQYKTADAGAIIARNTFSAIDSALSALNATFKTTDRCAASSRRTFTSIDTALATLHAVFSPIWPAPFIGSTGLHEAATVSASGSLGILFNSQTLNQATLPGGDWGLAPLSGAFSMSSLGVRIAGSSSAVGSRSPLNTTALLNPATLSGGFGFTSIWPQTFISSNGLKKASSSSPAGSLGILFGAHLNLAGFRHGQDVGFSRFYSTFTNEDAGSSAFRLTCIASDQGSNSQPARYHIADWGQTNAIYQRHSQDVGVCRIAQAGLAGYQLYLGTDAAPDLIAPPWQTFATKPFTTPALTAGHTYQLVLQQVNEFGLSSQNATAWTVTPSGDGIAPSAPTAINITPAAGGTVTITAAYDWRDDGANAADSYLIYIRNDGSNPNPATDTPTIVAIWKGAASAVLNWQSPAATEGATVKVLVRVRRSGSDGADSVNTAAVSAIATFIGPAGFKGVLLEALGIGESEGF